MKAVIYARYSSDNQREESIEGQIRECTAYAEKNGITVLKHYIDRDYCALVNDWIPCTYVDTVKVWLPLPDAFVYLSLEADEQMQFSASEFIRMLEADGGAELNPYNTIASFCDGMFVQVMHASYPFGPEE